MKSKTLLIVKIILLVLTLYSTFQILRSNHQVFSASDHVVISEIQTSGIGGLLDEFVELYNPTGINVDLTKWRLQVESSSSATQSNLVASLSGTIAPHGYYLIANPDYTGSILPDRLYSATTSGIANTNNSVVLYSDAGTTRVDTVGFGQAVDKEMDDASNPPDNGSIERKANSFSTSQTMAVGGNDEFFGNGQDSENNANDFVQRIIPQPQNALSPTEIPIEPTATPTPEITPTETPLPTVTPETTLTPTLEPTITPSPEPTATPEPTTTPTPMPTVTPTLMPTSTPEPSLTPTPSETPTPIPTATPTTVPTITPTLMPTETPTPIPSLTPSPSESPTPTTTLVPTHTPTPVLTATPSPTASVTPTPTPIITPTPTPLISEFVKVMVQNRLFVCTMEYRPYHWAFGVFFIPYVNCGYR